uniref:Uncharacterized protein n=1 Tax=Timspurckia oligopyrenoides TaxID=708627 RepID=A0A7S0ZEF3_9RHOD|mmetsp:Transcript_2013/g.3569  ORF Transcript_2013/g.3569 Transcript_2013/m.3569 type:complete len:448 (+) Transcript_2013:84-1427(+)
MECAIVNKAQNIECESSSAQKKSIVPSIQSCSSDIKVNLDKKNGCLKGIQKPNQKSAKARVAQRSTKVPSVIQASASGGTETTSFQMDENQAIPLGGRKRRTQSVNGALNLLSFASAEHQQILAQTELRRLENEKLESSSAQKMLHSSTSVIAEREPFQPGPWVTQYPNHSGYPPPHFNQQSIHSACKSQPRMCGNDFVGASSSRNNVGLHHAAYGAQNVPFEYYFPANTAMAMTSTFSSPIASESAGTGSDYPRSWLQSHQRHEVGVSTTAVPSSIENMPHSDPIQPKGALSTHSTEHKDGESKVKGPWRPEEDRLLSSLVEKYGAKGWTVIASRIPGRTGKQARERWLNQLNPDLAKRTWTKEEDMIIMEMHARMGNRWSEIAKALKGRTDNSVKNRFNTTIRRQISEYTSMVRNNPADLQAVKAAVLAPAPAQSPSSSRPASKP